MSIKASPSFSLKDQLFNTNSVAALSKRMSAAHPGFAGRRFERAVLQAFPRLELKERIHWMVTCLEAELPPRYPAALAILHRALPPPLDPSRSDGDFGEFIWAVPGEYVARHGARRTHLQRSLEFLRESTKRFSAESAIRPFLRDFPRETLDFLRACTDDGNYHVRRLASEGIRPFLPWAMRVDLPLEDIVGVLDRLHADRTRYVTRSVANCLNDVSRIDGATSLKALQRWHRARYQQSAELDWMTRHALRTLVRNDNDRALALLGYPLDPKFRLSQVRTTSVVKVGESFEWQGTLTSAAPQWLKLAMRIHFLKANGRHAPRVFKVADVKLDRGARFDIHKRLALRPATTRTLYPGTHFAELVVNGVARRRQAFELVA